MGYEMPLDSLTRHSTETIGGIHVQSRIISTIAVMGLIGCACLCPTIIYADPNQTSAAQPDAPKACYRSGMQEFADGHMPQALRLFRQAAEGSSGYLRLCAWNMIGQTARLQGDSKVALQAFAKVGEDSVTVVKTRGDSAVTRNAAALGELALIYQAEILEEQEQWPAAIALYERLMQAKPASGDVSPLAHNAAMYEKMGRLYWRVGSGEQATTMFRRLLERWPDCPRRPLVQLALAAVELQPAISDVNRPLSFLGTQPEDSSAVPASQPSGPAKILPSPFLERIRRVIADERTSQAWQALLHLRLGCRLLEAGQLDEAAKALEQATGTSDATAGKGATSGYARLAQALVMTWQGQQEQAIRLVQSVISEGPGNHMRDLAANIMTSVAARQQSRRLGDKCNVEPLK